MDSTAAVERLAALVLEQESRAAEVARLLHDQAGQALTAAGFHLQAGAGAGESAEALRVCLDTAIENVRIACNRLQGYVVERSGLSLAINMLAESLRSRSGLDIHLQVETVRGIPPAAGHAVYRVVELALDNVQRHAGTGRAEVRLESVTSGIRCEIRDEGCGFDVESNLSMPSGTGLVLMAAYARAQALHFYIASAPSQGTIVGIQTF